MHYKRIWHFDCMFKTRCIVSNIFASWFVSSKSFQTLEMFYYYLVLGKYSAGPFSSRKTIFVWSCAKLMIHEGIAVVAFMVTLTSFPFEQAASLLLWLIAWLLTKSRQFFLGVVVTVCAGGKVSSGGGCTAAGGEGLPARTGRDLPSCIITLPSQALPLSQEGTEHMVIIYCPHLCTIYSLSVTPTTIPTISSPAVVSLHWRVFFFVFCFFQQIRTHGPIREVDSVSFCKIDLSFQEVHPQTCRAFLASS